MSSGWRAHELRGGGQRGCAAAHNALHELQEWLDFTFQMGSKIFVKIKNNAQADDSILL